jgi:hypothetical protein
MVALVVRFAAPAGVCTRRLTIEHRTSKGIVSERIRAEMALSTVGSVSESSAGMTAMPLSWRRSGEDKRPAHSGQQGPRDQ